MGIFKRVKTIVQSDVHSFLDRVEDPINMIKQYIRELEQQLEHAQEALAGLLLAERKHETLIAQTEALLNKRGAQAALAVDRGEEDIAHMAIREKLVHQERLGHYRAQYDSLQEQKAQLIGQIGQLKSAYDMMEAKKHYLMSRVQTAETLRQVNGSLQVFSADQALRGFARMEEKVWKLEADAGARRHMQSVYGSGSRQNLLEDSVRLELDALKQQRQAGKAPAVTE